MPEQKRQISDAAKYAAVWGGTGPRSWRALEPALGSRSDAEAFAVRHRDVAERMRLALDPDPAIARSQAQRFLRDVDGRLERGLGVAGFIGYEVGASLESRRCVPPEAPDSLDAELIVFSPRAVHRMQLPPSGYRSASLPSDSSNLFATLPASIARQRPRFEGEVSAALDRIGRGGIYQVNLSIGAEIAAPDALLNAPLDELLGLILDAQTVPYAFALDTLDGRLLSGSMERFIARNGHVVRSRPIKGTAPRGHDPASDEHSRAQLIDSPKERAENTMIVDMVRNDLARVCEAGSVEVPTYLSTIAYRTLWHLESEVEGQLESGCSHAELLTATMPPASVTGCPKIAAMDVIEAAENRRRNAYCGAIGVALGRVVADWSVGIRTVTVRGDRARVDVGAGIVAGSDPGREWHETCAKAMSALSLVQRANHLTGQDTGRHFGAGSVMVHEAPPGG